MPRKPRTDMHCQYVSPLGRQCRQLRAQGHPSFCQHHSLQPQQALSEAVAAQLLGQLEDLPAARLPDGQGQAGFTSAAAVNQFLANLLRMTARGLIARRDAAVLAYIAQSLLNGLAARRRELLDEQALAENEPVTVVWDIPRPDRGEEQSRDPDPHSDRAKYERLCSPRRASDQVHGAGGVDVAGACPVPAAAGPG